VWFCCRVEDNMSNVRLMERVMERRPGVELMVAMQGNMALDLAFEHRPDLILLDLHLPDISGEEVLRRLRSDPRTADTPIVMLSADATSGRARQLIEAGAVDYLTKPFDIQRLLAVLDTRRTVGLRTAGPAVAPMAPTPVAETNDQELVPAGILGFVHDFSNLLNIVLNYCALLSSSVTDPVAMADIEQIRVAAQRATVLTRRLPTATLVRLVDVTEPEHR
jgi:CheY-like chemotaxis protein